MLIGREKILRLLRAAPEGLTSAAVAAELSVTSRQLGGPLSKLAAYGEIEKIKSLSPSAKPKWRVSQKKVDCSSPTPPPMGLSSAFQPNSK